MPGTLKDLYCYNTGIEALPTLPATLKMLNCSNNKLTALPELPGTLENLSCYNTGIEALPTLPATLYYLDCSDNELSALPKLPETLETLYIYGNDQITNIVAEQLPAGLIDFESDLVKNDDGDYTLNGEIIRYFITVGNVENGIVTIDQKEVTTGQKIVVVAGQKVEIQAVPKEGYRLEGISGVDGLEDIAEYAYTFVMPEKDITITPLLTKLTQEAEVPNEVVNAEKVKEILLETLKENEDFAELINNNNVKIKLLVDGKEEIATADKEKIEEAASKKSDDIKIAKYLDISISVTTEDGTFVNNLEKLKEEITFKVKIPTDLPKLEEGCTRTYYIVRNHNGEIKFLDTKVSGDELEFSSDLFSTYAIAYSDAKTADEGTSNEQPSGDTLGTGATGTPSVGNNENSTENKDNQDTSKEEKDESPKMGTIDIVLYVSALVAVISLAGIVMVKKYTK